MNKIDKFLLKLTKEERLVFLEILKKIAVLDLDELDIKKLQGTQNEYRLRKGKIRIIFEKRKNKGIIKDIGFRGDIY